MCLQVTEKLGLIKNSKKSIIPVKALTLHSQQSTVNSQQ
jgi:hypothetical protein